MKLCKDCKHCAPGYKKVMKMMFGIVPTIFDNYVQEYNQESCCNHPNNLQECPVSGEKTRKQDFCTILRGDYLDNGCGNDAKWFEQKS